MGPANRVVLLSVFAMIATLSASCAARVDPERDDGGRGDALDGSVTTGEDAGRDVRFRDVPIPPEDVFREPPCPDGSTDGVRMYSCDPLTQRGCSAGEACYPYIEYPMGRCAREIYRAECVQAGTSQPGSACEGSQSCVAGSTCFATGAGTRCLRLCRLDGTEPRCPRGAVCEPTDIPDFGACD
ncbi:MAG: hypothetical protein Q8Q09_27155 [Deltaproteobacteria bacterium]|nr:hypothetical protein [Deltaproteobacteria bacterium]